MRLTKLTVAAACLCAALLFPAPPAAAQAPVIRGKVLMRQPDGSVAPARFVVGLMRGEDAESMKYAETGDDGLYSFTGLPGGVYKVIVFELDAEQRLRFVTGIEGPEPDDREQHNIIVEIEDVTRARKEAARKSRAGGAGAAKTAASSPTAEADRLFAEADKLLGADQSAKALPVAERALAAYTAALGASHAQVGETHNLMGLIYSELGRYDREEQSYREAVAVLEKALGPEHARTARVLNNLGTFYLNVRRDYARAEPLMRRAYEARMKTLGPEHAEVANSLDALGSLYRETRDYERAEQFLTRALALYEKVRGPAHTSVAQAAGNLGALYMDAGDYRRALPLFQRALEIDKKASGPEHPLTAGSYNNLGMLAQRMGHYDIALHYLNESLEILERAFGPDHPEVGDALARVAYVYQRMGQYSGVEPLLRRALAIKEKAYGADSPALVGVLLRLAYHYHSDEQQSAKAEPYFRRALEISEKTYGAGSAETRVPLHNYARFYADRGDYARAEEMLRRALRLAEQARDSEEDVAAMTHTLAGVYLQKGDYASAEPLYLRVHALREKVLGPDHRDTATALNFLALLYRFKGDVPQAVAYQTRANEARERDFMRNLRGGSERQRAFYLMHFSGEADATYTLHLRDAPRSAEAGRLALTTALRRKGRVLDLTSDQYAALRRSTDEAEREVLGKLLKARSELAALVVRGPGRGPRAAYDEKMSDLIAQVEGTQLAVGDIMSLGKDAPAPVTVERVQAAIPAGAVLVEVVAYNPYLKQGGTTDETFGPQRYAAYVLARDGSLAWADLGETAPVDAEVKRLRAALRDPRADVRPAARALDEKVMRPIRRLLPAGVRRLIVSPDGALNLVPFAALVDEQDKYLVETYSISYLTSGRDLLRLQAPAPPAQPPLVLADPAFGPLDKTGAAAGGGDYAGVLFTPLAGTAGEAAALQTLLPQARVLTGAQATEAALKSARGPRVLHVATHGFFLTNAAERGGDQSRGLRLKREGGGAVPPAEDKDETNTQLRSGIALAGANQRASAGGEDGILTALEAAGLDLAGTRLVVLSACETGLGDVLPGDGVFGLRRALVLAGSESQLMTLWKVSDEATRDLMIAYYEQLEAGAGRAEALRRVQLEALAGGAQGAGAGPKRELGIAAGTGDAAADRRHPFFWAGFIASGDWRDMSGKEAAAP